MPRHVLPRPALEVEIATLEATPLTLVSAPAGSGKSTLLRQWVAGAALPHTVVAIERTAPAERQAEVLVEQVGALAGRTLPEPSAWSDGAGQPTGPLVSALARLAPHLLVIDDARDGEPDPSAAVLAAAIAQAEGCGLRLVVARRAAAAPEVARLLLDGSAQIYTADDLRLTPEQVVELVQAIVGTTIDLHAAADLVEELDGWCTGLTFAARCWPNRPRVDLGEVLAAAADAIHGYLRTEVLDHLPPEVLRFLEATAPLPVLSPALCDRITGGTESLEHVAWLRRHGVFVEPTGQGRHLWRCSRALRGAVRSTTDVTPGHDTDAVLGDAATWYVDNGMTVEAAECLVELREWGRLHEFLGAEAVNAFADGRSAALLRALRDVPPHVYRERLIWSIAVATLRMAEGQVARALEMLTAMQPLLGPEEAVRAHNVRCFEVGWTDDAAPFIGMAAHGLELCDELGDAHRFEEPDHRSRTVHFRASFHAAGRLACAFEGAWADAEQFRPDLPAADRAGLFPPVESGIRSQRAVTMALAGDARGALHEARAGLELAEQIGMLRHPIIAECHLGLGEALRLAGQHGEAAPALEDGLELSDAIQRHNGSLHALAALVHLDVDLGRPHDALARIAARPDLADRRGPKALRGLLVAGKARALAALGQATEAVATLRDEALSPATAATACAIHLQQGRRHEVQDLLQRWPDDPTAASTLRRTLVYAALHEALGRSADADLVLSESLPAAERLDHVQPYLELAPVLRGPLRRLVLSADARPSPFALRLREVLLAHQGLGALPLTERETTILGLLAQGKTLAQASEAIFVSINTVKTHVRSIYRKLGVGSRAEAVRIWSHDRLE